MSQQLESFNSKNIIEALLGLYSEVKDSGFNPNLEGPEHEAEQKAKQALMAIGLVDDNGNLTGNKIPVNMVKITVEGGVVQEEESTDENVEFEIVDLDEQG